MQLGFFPDFKGQDSLLLDGTSKDVAFLSAQLKEFVSSSLPRFPVHAFANVSQQHPAELFAIRSAAASAPGFCWLCSPGELPAIQSKLATLAESKAGHQYFALAGSNAQLVVSVGEYGEAWWESHA